MKQILINLLKKEKFNFLIVAVFIVINIILIAYPSKILGQIIDMLGNIQANKEAIAFDSLILILLGVGILGIRIVWKYIDFFVCNKLVKKLKDELFAKLMRAKIDDLNGIKNGEIMTYFVSDIRRVVDQPIRFFEHIIRILTYFVVLSTMMTTSCNIKLTALSLIPVIISVIVVILLRNRVAIALNEAQTSYTKMSEYVQESTDSVRTMKAFCGEEKQINEFKRRNKLLRDNNLKVTNNNNLLDIINSFGFGLAYAIALGLGSTMVINNEITLGELVAFNGYMIILERPVSWLPWVLKCMKKFKVSYNRLSKLCDLNEEDFDITDEQSKNHSFDGHIEVKDLTYSYPGYIETALEHISIDVKKGETLGIIGMVGSGKTTLMNLLLRLYDVKDGKIFIDGKDINTIPVKEIRNNICYITQDNFLFSSTLKDNINLFKDEYSENEIIDSTKNAMIYDDIQDMEQGIFTIIGEKGVDLSGGQKQRVVISRAFLNNSDIIIFDDTFSALDNKTEQHVLNNIKELTKNKTCIIVSNRISDIKDCDKIIVLDQGKIVERGNHNSLVNLGGKYFEFFENQAHKADEPSFLD